MSSTPVLPPEASLERLPAEVKSRIAELCAQQDKRLKETWAALEAHAVAALPAADELLALVRHQRGKPTSLGSLFCASRVWSEIAAPFRFRSLKASRTTAPAFRFRIATLRARHFTHIDLDKSLPPDLDALLSLLPLFVSIKSLALHEQPAEHLLGASWSLTTSSRDWHAQKAFTKQTLRDLLSRVEALILHPSNAAQVNSVLAAAPRVLSLELHCSGLNAAAPSAVQLPSSLRRLAIISLSPRDFPSTLCVPARPPLLESLTWQGTALPPSFIPFAGSFAASLCSLAIEVRSNSGGTYGVDGFEEDPCFPSLTELRLAGDALHSATRRTARSSAFISSVYVSEWGQRNGVAVFPYPTELFPEHAFVAAEPLRFWATDGPEGKDLLPAVDRTMAFLADWHEQAKKAARPEEYARLAAVLRAAELERVAMAS
ncbi:hypothetical protein JCM10213_002346 [Rhodosporidiobolus nylandii]